MIGHRSRRRRAPGDTPRVRVRRSLLGHIPLASTSDVAFLLTIFFLSTAVIGSQLGLPLVLPAAGAAAVAVAEGDVLRVRLDAGGRISVGGRALTGLQLADWALAREGEHPGRIYVLEVNPACPYRALVAALDALREARVQRVSFRHAGRLS